MSSRIIAYQQRVEVQIIERLVDMALSGHGDSDGFKEGFTTLQLIVEDDPEMDDGLKPRAYFEDQLVFDDRATKPAVVLWMTRLHRYIDGKSERRMGR